MRSNLSSLAGSDLMEVSGEEMEGDVPNFKGDSVKKSRLATLRDMFTEIDTSGELIDSLNSPALDPIRQKREQRADIMSQSLDPAGYVCIEKVLKFKFRLILKHHCISLHFIVFCRYFEFSSARRAAFVNSRLTQHRFLEWLTTGIDASQGTNLLSKFFVLSVIATIP